MARVTLWAETTVAVITATGGSVSLLMGRALLGALLLALSLGIALRLQRLTRSRRASKARP